MAAADAARQGRYALGHALIARVEAKAGPYAAACARLELRRYVGLENDALNAANRRLQSTLEICDEEGASV